MLGASARYSCLRVPVETGTPPRRRSKLHIPRFAAGGKARSFRCSSSPNRTRFAGLRFGRRLCRPNLSILGKLHIPRFAASGKARSFRCSSSPNRTRFAGLRFGRRLCRPNLSILGKLHIPRFAASGKARSFRCSSSPNRTRLAGVRFGGRLCRRAGEETGALPSPFWGGEHADALLTPSQARGNPPRRSLRS